MMSNPLPQNLLPHTLVRYSYNTHLESTTQTDNHLSSTETALPTISNAKLIKMETPIGLDVFENKGSRVKDMTLHQSITGEKSTTLSLNATDGNTYLFHRDNTQDTPKFEPTNTVRKAEQLLPYYRTVHPTLQIDNPTFRPPSVSETLKIPSLPDPITIHYTEGFDGMPQLEIPFGSDANNLAIAGFTLDTSMLMHGNPMHSQNKTKSTDDNYWKVGLTHGVRLNALVEQSPLEELETTVKQWVKDVNAHELLATAKTLPRIKDLSLLDVEETQIPNRHQPTEDAIDQDQLNTLVDSLVHLPQKKCPKRPFDPSSVMLDC
jgi:hypothetical protein